LNNTINERIKNLGEINMPVISNVNGIEFEPEIKTRVRFPNMMGGYIQKTFISEECANEYVYHSGWLTISQQRKAKIFPA